MKAVILEVPPGMIEERRRLGIDRRDELWEGVYHMVPPPTGAHQGIVDGLFVLLSNDAAKHGLGRLVSNLGVREAGSGDRNYRIPEWIFLRSGREGLVRPESSYVDGGPDAVLEVRSPGDETDEKLPFYEKAGVGEVLTVDRDTRAVQVLRLAAGRFVAVSPNADGWIHSEGLRAFFKTAQRAGSPMLQVMLELDRAEHTV